MAVLKCEGFTLGLNIIKQDGYVDYLFWRLKFKKKTDKTYIKAFVSQLLTEAKLK